MATGDFNGDGKTDLLLQGTTASYHTLLLLANGSGGFGIQDITDADGMSGQAWGADQRQLAAGDFNGDGKTDILLQGKTTTASTLLLIADGNGGFNTVQFITDADGMSGQAWAADQRQLAAGDFNGDGKTDILLQGKTTTASTLLLIADGNGGFNTVQFITNSYGMTGDKWSADQRQLAAGDFNGDGKTDILLQGTAIGNATLFLIANGSGEFYTVKNITTSYGMSSQSWSKSERYLAVGDFNGDGKFDILLQGATSARSTLWLLANTIPQNLLSEVKNGLGATTTISYTSSTSYSNTLLPFPVQTVSYVSSNDGNGNISTTNYTYSDGFYHIGEKDFRGFNYAKVTGPAGPNGEQKIAYTWFHQGNGDTNAPDVTVGYMKGKPYRTKVTGIKATGGSEYTYSETTASYVSDSTSPYFNPPYQVDSYIYDGDSTWGKQTRVIYAAYDSYGNITTEYQYGDYSDSSDDRTITRSFGYNTTSWIVGLPTSEVVYEGIGISGTKKSETKYFYDQITDCNTSATNQTPVKGNMTRVERWLSGGTNPSVKMAYNTYGNLKCSADANGNITNITTYDSTNTFPKTVANPLGYQTTTKYYGVDGETGNGLYGQVKSVTDPNNHIL
ncbi:MAG: toxin TcdB middle/N-terminal domain-containing protein [Deltaproteobacteria bacterium]|nr:toxin TcdB middle/N-terminal domain-containing protein [Deltaproteobacteria bacterium]